MIRISLPYLINVVATLEPLARLSPEDDRLDLIFPIWSAKSKLEELMHSSVFSGEMRICRDLAQQLIVALDNFDSNLEKKVENYEVWAVTNLYSQFKTALLAELGVAPSYYVSRKPPYETAALLDSPEALFPEDLALKVPESVYDVQQCGSALAFELPTACGFHVFRITEAVLRRYYTHETGGKTQPKVRNIAVYINAMRQSGTGDDRILAALEQLSRLHRNPLIHPEAILSMDEAIATLGMSRSVITAMLAALPTAAPTTSTYSPSGQS